MEKEWTEKRKRKKRSIVNEKKEQEKACSGIQAENGWRPIIFRKKNKNLEVSIWKYYESAKRKRIECKIFQMKTVRNEFRWKID